MSMNILLIEDDIDIAHFLMRGFRSEACQVSHAEDAEEALRMMKDASFDILILDLLLPGASGEEFLKTLRQNKDITPVIVLTAISDPEIKIRLLDLGADDYLAKPFSFIELMARVKSVLRRCKADVPASEIMKVGDLALDASARTVTRAGKPIKLRLKEFRLLEYFMRHPNKVLSRNMILEKVWDYNAALLSNTVDAHVSLLRNKLNKGFERKLIETVHGVGYILKDQPS